MIIAPARRTGDPDSNPGPGENFSLKLIIYIIPQIEKSFSKSHEETGGQLK